MFVKILLLNGTQKVLAVYRTPSGNLSAFYEVIDEHDELSVVGDYFVANNSVMRHASGQLLVHIMLKNNINALIYTS